MYTNVAYKCNYMYVCMYVLGGVKEEGNTDSKVYVGDDITSSQTPEEVQVIEESKNAVILTVHT